MEQKVDNIMNVIFEEMEQSFRLFSELFLQTIKIDQLEDKGIDGNNIKLKMPYSDKWASIRKSHSLPTDRRTLNFKGKFYESLSISFDNDSMTIESKGVDYAKFLTADNGIDILRPNQEFIYEMFFTAVMPQVKKNLIS